MPREIFLVDDEVEFTDTMSVLLETVLGMRVRSFNHPRRALEMIESSEPACVISDLAMPDLNGFEFLAEVARLRPDVPAVLVTGNHLEPGTIEANRSPNLIGVLFKPLSWRDIAALLREHALLV